MGRIIVVEPNSTIENKEENISELKEVLKHIARSLNKEQLKLLDNLNKATKETLPKETIRC
ncbi:Uncharacterised protein [uncultured Clostridium sp.]|uniref:hypothetical protein n=1 Tax=uncultured Clostridium sp. TaxID=59620 RepID=UPI0008206639|nr:hypothetical protein [uncultured Clostridium sp.]SCJ51194.1 Uncharacterised protein [uncultured Clostridium sp.]